MATPLLRALGRTSQGRLSRQEIDGYFSSIMPENASTARTPGIVAKRT